jgi:predicted extracellular nuclease
MFLRTRGRASGCLTLTLLAIAGTALAQSPNIVISQVYGGGGNSGAPYRNDFVELFNLGDAAFTMPDWSIQYASFTGTSWGSQKLVIPSATTLQPGQYYLIQLASGGSSGVALPTPDLIGNLDPSATRGKLALVNRSTSLPAITCPDAGHGVVDLIGYGAAANCFEGDGPAPGPANATAVLRADGGCTDTDNNNLDFSVLAPDPRNTSSAFHVCPGAVTGACCVDTTCYNGRTQAQCSQLGGVWKGAGTTCTPDPCVCRGDCNCDGIIDFDDINAFVAAMSGGTPCSAENCDVNNDGVIDFDDINPFVEALSTGTLCP